MKRKSILIGVLVLAGIAAALGFFWPFGDRSGTLYLHGIVEIQEVRLGSKVGGRVKEVHVAEGVTVKAGDLLVEFEAPELQAQKKELTAELEKARADRDKLYKTLPLDIEMAEAAADAAKTKLEKTKLGWRPEEKKMAQDDLKVAEADLKFANLEKIRVKELFDKNSAAKGEMDLAVANLERAESKLNAATTKVKMMKEGWAKDQDIAEKELQQSKLNHKKLDDTKYEVKRQADETVNVLEAKLEKLNVDLEETKVRAKSESIVEVVSVRKGDLVAPNQPIVRVLMAEDMWVKVFVPETELGKIRLNQDVQVLMDSYPSKHFAGKVVQVGTIAEFTPRNVQSKEERRYQVFPVKIRVTDPHGIFKAGMAAEVIVPPAPGP